MPSSRVSGPGGSMAALPNTTPPAPRPSDRGWRSSLATAPGMALALLPKVACPACWPAYASVFTSLGLGFLLDVRWLFPATSVFLLIAVASLGFRARQRRGLGPFAVGLGASAIILCGKYGLGADSALYAGVPLLIGASIWNTWPRQASRDCPTCSL
jgi:mercuric ion transport protein